jgi:predicted metal-binding membrane protein
VIRALAPSSARRVPPVVIAAIVGAWVIAVTAQATGAATLLHHDALAEGDVLLPVAILLFLVALQLMIVAMMLPSSFPLIRTFQVASARLPHRSKAMAALIAGYLVVWTAFGSAAFLGDVLLHRLVDQSAWLRSNPHLISGFILVLAGLFQFSDLKDRCLRECRHPGAFLLRHYRRGAAAAFELGRKHGLFCLGCCWALMLVGFAVGLARLWWMAALTAVMVYEKTGRNGDKIVAPIGATLIMLGALTVVMPAFGP